MLCVELHPLLTHLHRGLESPKMNTFHDISQCLQEIVIDHKKMNTKEKVDGRKVGHFLITIQKSFKLIINQLRT